MSTPGGTGGRSTRGSASYLHDPHRRKIRFGGCVRPPAGAALSAQRNDVTDLRVPPVDGLDVGPGVVRPAASHGFTHSRIAVAPQRTQRRTRSLPSSSAGACPRRGTPTSWRRPSMPGCHTRSRGYLRSYRDRQRAAVGPAARLAKLALRAAQRAVEGCPVKALAAARQISAHVLMRAGGRHERDRRAVAADGDDGRLAGCAGVHEVTSARPGLPQAWRERQVRHRHRGQASSSRGAAAPAGISQGRGPLSSGRFRRRDGELPCARTRRAALP